MKRLILLAMTLIFTHSMLEGAQSKRALHVSLGAAYETMDGADAGAAAVLEVAAPVLRLGRHTLLLEGVATRTVMPPSYSCCGVSLDITATTASLYTAYELAITNRFYVKPRVGFGYMLYDADISGNAGNVNIVEPEDDTNAVYGIGAGIRLSPVLELYGDYSMIDGSDYTQATAGVRYRLHF